MQAWKESIDMRLVNLILTTSGLVLQRMQGPRRRILTRNAFLVSIQRATRSDTPAQKSI